MTTKQIVKQIKHFQNCQMTSKEIEKSLEIQKVIENEILPKNWKLGDKLMALLTKALSN